MAIDLGTGSSITATIQSAFFTANLTSIEWSGISRQSIPTSTMASTVAKTYIPGDLYDAGELQVEFQYDPTVSVVTAITGAAEDVSVKFGGTATGLAASGFLTDVSISASGGESEALLTATGTVKFSAAITADVNPGA